MELLDRYLAAVKRRLPRDRQDDIIAELRANLESQLEDKESELGRPLTTDEAEAWIKKLGSPMQVAARYQPQQYLIGPGLFPTYWYVLRTALGWALAIYLVANGVELMMEAPSASDAVEAIVRVPGVLITVAAWVTVVFAVLEFSVARGMVKIPAGVFAKIEWSPNTLSPIEALAEGKKKRRTFAQAVGEVVFGFLGLVWLALVPRHPYLVFGPGAPYLQSLPYGLAPVWTQVYWWIIALNVIQLVWNTFNLWHGAWRGPRLVYKTVTGIFGLIPITLLLFVKDHTYLLLKNPATAKASEVAMLTSANEWIFKLAALFFVIATVQLAWEIGRKIVKARHKRAAR